MKTTEDDFNAEINKGFYLVFFEEQWNTESQKQLAILEKSIAALGSQVKLLTYDVDKDSELAEHLRITTIPTLLLFKDGQEVVRLSGFHHESALLKHIRPYTE